MCLLLPSESPPPSEEVAEALCLPTKFWSLSRNQALHSRRGCPQVPEHRRGDLCEQTICGKCLEALLNDVPIDVLPDNKKRHSPKSE